MAWRLRGRPLSSGWLHWLARFGSAIATVGRLDVKMNGNRNSGVRSGRVAWLPGAVLAATFLATPGLAQLPPEMEFDRLLLRAERYAENGEYASMAAVLDEALALAEEHGFGVPVDFWFRRARASFRAEDYQKALESVTRYLQEAGREGANYRQALELMTISEEFAEQEAAREEALRRDEEARQRDRDALSEGPDHLFPAAEWVRIPPGEFVMGSTAGDSYYDERPVTRVRISREFWLGTYEVTQSQWDAVMGSDPSHFGSCARCPVERVSWDDVQEFLRRLNTAAGGNVYRLPTEAEWEDAARAGTVGDRYGPLDEIAWCDDNDIGTHPVGQKAANPWGLHDMMGNVSEWVQDWYGEYPGGSVVDPVGPPSGSDRVRRGGNWSHSGWSCRVSKRGYADPGDRPDGYEEYVGFRLLRTR